MQVCALRVLMSLAIVAVVSADVLAQTQGRQMTSGARVASKELICAWNFWWDPPDGFGDVDVIIAGLSAGKSSYVAQGNGLGGFLDLGVTLDATYLPSTSYSCASQGAVIWSSFFGPYGYESHQFQWTNSDCDGRPVLYFGNDPNHSFWVTEELWNTDSNAASGASNAGGYWTGVGQAINYPTGLGRAPT